MPINHDVVGATGTPIVHSWTSKDALLYAVGVGAGIDELAFTTENSHDVPQRVLPTMAAVIGAGVSGAISAIGSFDFAMLVHGEQSFVQHREIPVEGSLTATGKIVGIYDKGSGAVVAVEGECVDNATGEPLLTVGSAIFIRGELLAISESWHQGPKVTNTLDPSGVGPLVEELMGKARPNADMLGLDRK